MKSTFKNKKFKAIPSIIPSTIFECEQISTGAKVFYGMLVFMSRQMTEIKASTYYFKTQMSRSSRSITNYIKELAVNKYLRCSVSKGVRYLIPAITENENTVISSYIPPEVVKNGKLSSSEKLTFGFLSYKAANVNDYFETSVSELTVFVNKSRSTIYRHLKALRKYQFASTTTCGNMIKIKCSSSYSTAWKNRDVERFNRRKTAPPEVSSEKLIENATISSKEADYLRNLVFGNSRV